MQEGADFTPTVENLTILARCLEVGSGHEFRSKEVGFFSRPARWALTLKGETLIRTQKYRKHLKRGSSCV
jgi:hypothetical protein